MGVLKHTKTLPVAQVPAGTATTKQVLIDATDGAPNFALRKFSIGPGGGMPLHTNTVEHVQYVLRGKARVQLGNGIHEAKAGDTVYIPAGESHSYENTGQEPFEFLCVVPNLPDELRLQAPECAC